jgi:3-phosphoshikimate 1-carboxyvinyltransferase
MGNFLIEPSQLHGHLTVPPSKSHTLRGILFGALARGVSCIEEYLHSPDTSAMIEAVRQLGAKVEVHAKTLEITGVGGHPQVPDDVIHCGNSGLVLRFIGALAGLLPQYTILTGDASIRHNRPVKPLLDALSQLGASAISSRGNDYAPLLIKGPFINNKATLDGQDSQPVSGLLIAAAFSPHPIEIAVTNPGEKPWIDLTLHWLDLLGIRYQAKNYTHYLVEGSSRIDGFHYKVPGDFSTAAFPIAAALLSHSELTLHNIDREDVQGDKAIIPILEKMGARFSFDPKKQTMTVEKCDELQGTRIDVNDFIDALPILAVIGCFAKGRTEIVNGSVARTKESDRIAAITEELVKMGAKMEEKPDGLIIHPSQLSGALVSSHHDHRIAFSLSVAAFAASSPSTISGVECMAKTYPTFYEDFLRVGAKMKKQ